jgi:hypothetical protein
LKFSKPHTIPHSLISGIKNKLLIKTNNSGSSPSSPSSSKSPSPSDRMSPSAQFQKSNTKQSTPFRSNNNGSSSNLSFQTVSPSFQPQFSNVNNSTPTTTSVQPSTNAYRLAGTYLRSNSSPNNYQGKTSIGSNENNSLQLELTTKKLDLRTSPPIIRVTSSPSNNNLLRFHNQGNEQLDEGQKLISSPLHKK